MSFDSPVGAKGRLAGSILVWVKIFQAELERNLQANRTELDLHEKVLIDQTAARTEPRSTTYILHVGGETWYKNRAGVLEIYSIVRKRLGRSSPDLIMVGPQL